MRLCGAHLRSIAFEHLVKFGAEALIAYLVQDAVTDLRVLSRCDDVRNDLELKTIGKSNRAQHSQRVVKEGLKRLKRRPDEASP